MMTVNELTIDFSILSILFSNVVSGQRWGFDLSMIPISSPFLVHRILRFSH